MPKHEVDTVSIRRVEASGVLGLLILKPLRPHNFRVLDHEVSLVRALHKAIVVGFICEAMSFNALKCTSIYEVPCNHLHGGLRGLPEGGWMVLVGLHID